MRITDAAIKFRTAVMVLTGAIFLGGVYAYVALPKESNPSIEIPNIVVTTIYAGASPADVESLITQPIEKEVAGISGIKEIRSTSTEGVSTVVVEFTPDVAMTEATQQVRDKVGIAKADLPTDAEEPIVNEIDLSEFPISVVNLAADYPLTQLKEVAEDLQDKIEALPAVLEVDLIGGLEREVQVDVDLARLQGYGLSFEDLVKAIRNENTNLPGGSIDVARMNYLVRIDGQFSDPSKIEGVVIKAPHRQPIFVRDVATVKLGFKRRTSYSRLRVLQREEGGVLRPVNQQVYQTVVSLNVKKRAGENILETAAAVRKIIADSRFPRGTQVLITGDQSEQVEVLVKDLENNIISGLVFVVAVLLFFLGARTSVLVAVAIPLSMFTSFLVMLLMGQTLNFIILFSLIIALGMLVDNAIVIVENIYRYLEEGHSPFEAARRGTGEVGMAVVASTATTVAAFIPMMFWPGIIGEFMSYMPMTLIITLTCSLFVAVVINPVVTGFFSEPPSARGKARSPWLRRTVLLVSLMCAAVLGVASPMALGVLAGGGLLLWLIHALFLRRLGDYFAHRALPAVVEGYRRFIEVMLQRDYEGRWRPMLRNTFALISFSAGLTLTILGGLVYAGLGPAASRVLLIPGGVLAAVGLLGILLHGIEVVLMGGLRSVQAGLAFAAVMGTALGLIALTRPLDELIIGQLLSLPAVILVLGLLGWPVARRRHHLVLTDNRAKLLATTLAGLFAIAGMYAIAPTGVAFFPDTDPNQIQVVADGPLGTNVDTSDRIARQVTDRIDAMLGRDGAARGNVKNLLVSVGVGGDTMFGGGAARAETSTLSLNLVDFIDRGESTSVTLTRLRAQLVGIPGAEIEFKRDQQGPPTGPPVNIEVSGPDFKQIVRLTKGIKERLSAAMDSGVLTGMVDLRDNMNDGRPEMQVRIDRERAARFGLNTRRIAMEIRSAINGADAGTWRDGEDEYDIKVRLRPEDRDTLEAVEQLDMEHEGIHMPVVAMADFELGSGLGNITRKDQQRVVTVMGNAAAGQNAQELLTKVQAVLADFERTLPAGYTLNYTGENKDQEESFSFLSTALATGVALITIILIAQFNSVTNPLIIMVAVALSMIGVLLGLIVTRTPFGLMTFIALISLAGIVVNNNIVLIDYMVQLRARGQAKRAAIIEAGATRLRPVLLTALTTVLGLIPLTFGINIDFVGLLTVGDPDFHIGSENTQFWGPMGSTIIAGLTFATFLTLVIVPVMYSALDSLVVRLQAAYRAPAEPETQAPAAGEG